jgi:formate-nitrite transporter family protein
VFTKNTLTVILPLLQKKELSLLGNVLRLWAWVLIANLAGAFFFAWLLANTNLFEPDIQKEFSTVALASIHADFLTMLLKGILAGWLIALMVWLLPYAETARIWVIVIIAYLIGIAGFPHVIAGSVETFYLVCRGQLSWLGCLGGCFAPTLVGNVVGGVALVAVGAHAEFGDDTPGNR